MRHLHLIGLFLLLFSISKASAFCDISVYSSKFPFFDNTSPNFEKPLCLEAYFKYRALMRYSLNEDPSQIARPNPILMLPNENEVYFYDFLLVGIKDKRLLESDEGMEEVIKLELSNLLLSLKHGDRHCDLQFFSGSRKLNIDDFSRESRQEVIGRSQLAKGRGLVINGKDFDDPRWELKCQNSPQEYELHSQGNYFFLYGSVYKNPSGEAFALGLHQMKYLIRLEHYPKN